MGFTDRIRKAADLLFHPSADAKGNYSVKKSLKFYYTSAIVGTVITLALLGIFSLLNIGTAAFGSVSLGGGIGRSMVLEAVVLLVLTPAFFFVTSALLQLVGRIFLKAWKGNWQKTFAAVAAAETPLALFWWLSALPVAGIFFEVLLGIWSIIVLIIALSVQQGTSRLRSLAVLLVSYIVIIAIVFAVVFAAYGLGLFNSALAPSLV